MADVLIVFDEQGFITAKDLIEDKAQLLQGIVELYNTTGLTALTTNDFYHLVRKPAELIFDKMTAGQPISIGGKVIDRAKAMEILEKPVNYDALLKKIDEVFSTLAQNKEWIMPLNYPVQKGNIHTLFEMDGASTVVLKASFLAQLENSFKRYAKTDAAKQMFSFAQTVVEAYETMRIKEIGFPGNNGSIGELLNSITDYYSNGRRNEIKVSAFELLNNNTFFVSGV